MTITLAPQMAFPEMIVAFARCRSATHSKAGDLKRFDIARALGSATSRIAVFSLLVLVLLGPNCAASAPARVFVAKGTGPVDLTDHLVVLKDTKGALTIEQVSEMPELAFSRPTASELKGVAEGVYWLKVAVDFRQYPENQSYLIVEPQFITRVDVFYTAADGRIVSENIKGEQLIGERDVAVRSLLFKLATPRTAPGPIFVRFEQRGQPYRLRVFWASSPQTIEIAATDELIQGLIFGALFMLVVHNVFVLYRTRDSAYLYYAIYFAFFSALIGVFSGWSVAILPIRPSLAAVVLANAGTLFGGIGFMRSFLELQKNGPRLDSTLGWIQAAGIATLIFPVTGLDRLGFKASILLVPFGMTFLAISCANRRHQGFRPARFLLIGLLGHGLITSVYVLQLTGVFQAEYVTLRWVEMSAVWEALWFSYALADRLRESENKATSLLVEQKLTLDSEQKERAAIEKAALEVQQALDQAQLANKDKNLFLSMISHELKTPLQAIATVLAVEEHKSGGLEMPASLKSIRWAADYMEAQMRDLFVLSLGDSGVLEMRAEPFEVGELVDEVLATQEVAAKSKGLSLSSIRPDDMLFVVADPRRIEQVLLNLIENAVKYTEKGRVTVAYGLQDNDTLSLVVCDTGVGIPKQHQDKLHTPFMRFGSIDRNRNSLGIGLAVVQKLLTVLGGTCQIESQPGVGSTFTVVIPVAPAEQSVAPGKIDGRLRVLIVDDRDTVLNDLCAIAETLGYEATRASSAAVAANYLAAGAYDAVFIDLDMPVKTGAELASETRRGGGPNANGLLIAISAGNAEAAGLGTSTSLWPFDAFVQKPIHPKDMLRVVVARTRSKSPRGLQTQENRAALDTSD